MMAALLLGLAATLAGAPPSRAPGLEGDPKAWLSFDPVARIEAVPGGGLAFDYTLREGGQPILARGGLDLSGARSLRFRVRSSHATGFAFGLVEGDESSYGTLTFLPLETWTEVAVNLDELQLAEDSKDENGRYDPGPGGALWFMDVAVMAQAGNPALRGPRRLLVEAVELRAEPVVSGASPRGRVGTGDYVVDSFESRLLTWMPVALPLLAPPARLELYPKAVRLSLAASPDSPLSLEVGYPRPGSSALVLLRPLQGPDLLGVTALSFAARAERPGTFLASLEERGGARYEQPFDLVPGEWRRLELPLAAFRLAGDSRDADGALELREVKQLSLIEANLSPKDAGPNVLRLDDVRFRRPER